MVIRICDSSNVLIEGLQMINSASWMHQYMNCENLILQGLKITNQLNGNNDGIDIDGCRRVIIRDCDVIGHDDALALKGNCMRPMEDVLVENCTLCSIWIRSSLKH